MKELSNEDELPGHLNIQTVQEVGRALAHMFNSIKETESLVSSKSRIFDLL